MLLRYKQLIFKQNIFFTIVNSTKPTLILVEYAEETPIDKLDKRFTFRLVEGP